MANKHCLAIAQLTSFLHSIFGHLALKSLSTSQLLSAQTPLLSSSSRRTLHQSPWNLVLGESLLAMDANIGDPRFQLSVEKAFEVQPQPGFWGQVTLRAMLVSALLGAVFCFMILRIQMTVGIVPSFNMPTTILSFFVLKCLISLMKSCGMATAPFTRQENMFVVTSVNNCINIALSGKVPSAWEFCNCTINCLDTTCFRY